MNQSGRGIGCVALAYIVNQPPHPRDNFQGVGARTVPGLGSPTFQQQLVLPQADVGDERALTLRMLSKRAPKGAPEPEHPFAGRAEVEVEIHAELQALRKLANARLERACPESGLV